MALTKQNSVYTTGKTAGTMEKFHLFKRWIDSVDGEPCTSVFRMQLAVMEQQFLELRSSRNLDKNRAFYFLIKLEECSMCTPRAASL